jgi:hypothetical protein
LIWRRGFNLWHILLLVVNCLLLLAIVNIWVGETGPSAPSRPGKGPELPKTPRLRDQQPLGAFQVVAARDLFSQDRKALKIEEKSGKAVASLEGKELMGTMIIGTDRVALISSKTKKSGVAGRAGSQVDVVRPGDDLDGFKVMEISNEAVVLQGKDGKQTLNFPD